MALGARSPDVVEMIVRSGMAPVLLGIAVGTVAALLLTRLMTSLLFEVVPGDPLTFVAVAATLLFVAALACAIPARRARGSGIGDCAFCYVARAGW